MSEALNKGPLDIVRGRTAQAAELDELARERLVDAPDMTADFAASVAALNDGHPLLGQKVIVYGAPLNAKAEAITAIALGREDEMTSTERHRRQSGTYGGLTVASQYFHQTGRSVLRVVHRVDVGRGDFRPDQLGEMSQPAFINTVLAPNSEVIAMRPLNAHSLIDLAEDPIVREVDQIMLDSEEEPIDCLTELGEVVNIGLEELGWDDGKNQQRASYLNGLDILKGIRLAASDFVLADAETYEGDGELTVSSPDLMTAPLIFVPQRFEVIARYERTDNGGVVIGQTPELAVAVTSILGENALVLMKNIVNLEAVVSILAETVLKNMNQAETI
jgi:hypothetical protein